jgi:hypothetical protein
MFKTFSAIIRIFHLLSLNVVLGAVLCNIMFWKLPFGNIHTEKLPVIVLGLSVWLIYILDRLMDNKKATLILTERHIFHQTYSSILWKIVLMIFFVCSILIFFLPLSIIKIGTLTSLLTAIYLSIIHRTNQESNTYFLKEPITALLYTIGVWGTTINNVHLGIFIKVGILFLLVTFQNLLLFSLFEIKKNVTAHNLASKLGIRKSNYCIKFITVLIVFLEFSGICYSPEFVYFKYTENVFILVMVMSQILLIINQFDTFFIKNDRYRWVGDGVFLLPLLIIF